MHENYTLSRQNMAEGRWWTLVTSTFSHNHPLHLIINMAILNTTANLGCSSLIGMSPARMAALALGSGVCGSLAFLYDSAMSSEGSGLPESAGLGASGMLGGTMMATMLAVPRLPMQLFPIPISVPYWVIVWGFFGFDLYGLYRQRSTGRRQENWLGAYVGYAAHLGGAAFGAAFYLVAMRRAMVFRRGRLAQIYSRFRSR